MELKDFVEYTLVQIIDGIEAARKKKGKKMISPIAMNYGGSKKPAESEWGDHMHDIEFDVAVTAASEKENKAGVKITVWSIVQGGASKTDKDTDSSISRIKFTIPIVYNVREHT